ncbi:hypothetical protein KPL78_13515 [Roseomonas sp. HJA6]|uniref:PilZ domain-containing protein n=1 Tax=Roseomonas alba TaxID=2846776 RepID=A0ABS7A996_9PROT|nr:hypothetical protein [Neoroseomonas alba]MBW6398877.1 hypothetical protein [Neoroseomonas alba]
MSTHPPDRIRCSRNWGVRRSLIVATLSGSGMLRHAGLRFSGSGIGIEVLDRRAEEVDIAIDIAGDAAIGPRSLILAVDGRLLEVPDVFAVMALVLGSSSGAVSQGIGSHLL